MERVCVGLRVRDGMEAEYDRRHRSVWPELEEEMRKAGVRELAVFRHERSVICCFKADPDAATVVASLDGGEASARWDAYLADVLEESSDDFTEVWHLPESRR